MISALILLFATATPPSLTNMPLDNRELEAIGGLGDDPIHILHDIVVGPDGRVWGCTARSRSPQVDALVCRSFHRRARFKPAVDDAGRPAYGELRSISGYQRNGIPPRVMRPPDVEVRIRPVKGIDLPARIAVFLSVDATGLITKCAASAASKPAALAVAACAQAQRLSPLRQIKGEGGLPVASVRHATIGFSADIQAK